MNILPMLSCGISKTSAKMRNSSLFLLCAHTLNSENSMRFGLSSPPYGVLIKILPSNRKWMKSQKENQHEKGNWKWISKWLEIGRWMLEVGIVYEMVKHSLIYYNYLCGMSGYFQLELLSMPPPRLRGNVQLNSFLIMTT